MNYLDTEEEEEKVSLITRSAKVVEHLLPIMSRELLCKFPDNSTFDFDYSQSSIWSPLVPRAYSHIQDLDLVTPRKLSYDFGLEKRSTNSSNKKKRTVVTAATALNLTVNLNSFKKKEENVKVPEFSPASVKTSCAPVITTKGWSKVLKAASKHFKKKKKKIDPAARLKLSSCLRNASS